MPVHPHCYGSRTGHTGTRAALKQGWEGIPPALGLCSTSGSRHLKGQLKVERGTEPKGPAPLRGQRCLCFCPGRMALSPCAPLHSLSELRASAETVLNPVMLKVTMRPNKCPV